jgi:predicted ATP-grasp superfamily ATP-dependent carboligase
MSPPRVGIVGRLGTPQLACLRSWRRQGVHAVLLHADSAPLPAIVGRLLGVPCVAIGPIELDGDGETAARERLCAAVREHGLEALTCVSESTSERLWRWQPWLPAGLRILAVRPEQQRVLESKSAQLRLAQASGLPALPNWAVASGAAPQVPQEHFPLALRPDVAARVRPAFKVAVVRSQAELDAFAHRLHHDSGAVVAQPLVRGPNVLVHAYRSPGGALGGHLPFKVGVKFRGVTVLMRPAEVDPSLIEGCRRMASELGLEGVFHFEFVQDEKTGQCWYLDLNPRLGGTTGKALAAGYDEPLALLATAEPLHWPRSRFVGERLTAVLGKHQALAALWTALCGTGSVADYPYPRRVQLLRALIGPLLVGRDEIVRLREWRSTLAFAIHQLGKLGRD